MDEIADESGTSKGGVYFHFPSKQAIFLALLDRTAARLLDNVEEAIASENDPIAKADAALLAVLRTFARHRGLARLFMVEALGAGREFHERVLQIHSDFARAAGFQCALLLQCFVLTPLLLLLLKKVDDIVSAERIVQLGEPDHHPNENGAHC